MKIVILAVILVLLFTTYSESGSVIFLKKEEQLRLLKEKGLNYKVNITQGARFMVAPYNCPQGASLDVNGVCRRVVG